MTREERAQRRASRKAQQERIDRAKAEARVVVAAGVCPDCGRPLRQNLSLTGWWQCEQFGAVGFRKDSTQPSCSFQCFTD